MSAEGAPTQGLAQESQPRRLQFATFVAVGVACAVVDVALMYTLLKSGTGQVTATSVGFLGGLFLNYLAQSRMTFGVQVNWARWWRFLCVVGLNYAITLLFVLAFESLSGAALLGKLVSLPVVALVGFSLSRRWIFQ